jgi:hypothetical protein
MNQVATSEALQARTSVEIELEALIAQGRFVVSLLYKT